MPAISLIPSQQAEHDAGRCACGCGVPIERPRWGPAPSIWASPACRQRGHRQRTKAGAVRSREARALDALAIEAAHYRAEAKRAKQQADYYLHLVKVSVEAAERIEAEISGQQTLIPMRAAQ